MTYTYEFSAGLDIASEKEILSNWLKNPNTQEHSKYLTLTFAAIQIQMDLLIF